MQLSKSFKLDEMTESQTGERLNIDNEPNDAVIANLRLLCQSLLQPIRDHWGPVFISSGYRSPELNRAIGGSGTSQHMTGQAADLKFSAGVDKLEVAKWVLSEGLVFDQMILEAYDANNSSRGWLHVSLTHGVNRRQVMTARFVGGRAQYSKGLPK